MATCKVESLACTLRQLPASFLNNGQLIIKYRGKEQLIIQSMRLTHEDESTGANFDIFFRNSELGTALLLSFENRGNPFKKVEQKYKDQSQLNPKVEPSARRYTVAYDVTFDLSCQKVRIDKGHLHETPQPCETGPENNMRIYGSDGERVQCPKDYIMAGWCSSGRKADCRNEETGAAVVTTVQCQKKTGSWNNLQMSHCNWRIG